jgi:hypothetical protein
MHLSRRGARQGRRRREIGLGCSSNFVAQGQGARRGFEIVDGEVEVGCIDGGVWPARGF